MPVRGNRGLVGSPERPPSTLDPPQVSSSILSSPCWFKSHARPPSPPALLLVPHQLTSPAGAASRDLLLVCSGSTHQFGLARRGHVDSKVPLFASRSVDRIRAPYPRHPADSFRLSVVAGVEVSSQSAAALTPFLRS